MTQSPPETPSSAESPSPPETPSSPHTARRRELVLDRLTDQLDRTRRLLAGDPDAAAADAMAHAVAADPVEAQLAVQLADQTVLAEPDRFPEAHRLTMHALELLDREGSRDPQVPDLGPLSPLLEILVGSVVEMVVKSYAKETAGTLRKLYGRREVKAPPGDPERRLLASARIELDRVAPGYGGSFGALPALLLGGALLPALAGVSHLFGAIDLHDRPILGSGGVLLFLLFLALSWVLLRGAAIAHRRCIILMEQPLAALWETIGHAGHPPEDTSVSIATIAVGLTALCWFVVPLTIALVVFL